MKRALLTLWVAVVAGPSVALPIEAVYISSTWNVSLFNVQAQTPINSVPISTTRDIQISADGRTAYVTQQGLPGIQRYDVFNGGYLGYTGPYSGNLDSFVISPSRDIFAVDTASSRILKIPDIQGAPATQFIAPFVVIQPSAIALDKDGNLYVAAQSGGVIRKFNGTTGALMATVYSPPIGQSGHYITDMDFGPDGFLYCTSFNNGSVIRINPATGAITKTYGGPGPNFLFSPKGIAFTAGGEMLVSSSASIRRINPVTGDTLGTFASFYTATFSTPGRMAVGFVPEPSTLLALGAGLAGIGLRTIKRRR